MFGYGLKIRLSPLRYDDLVTHDATFPLTCSTVQPGSVSAERIPCSTAAKTSGVASISSNSISSKRSQIFSRSSRASRGSSSRISVVLTQETVHFPLLRSKAALPDDSAGEPPEAVQWERKDFTNFTPFTLPRQSDGALRVTTRLTECTLYSRSLFTETHHHNA